MDIQALLPLSLLCAVRTEIWQVAILEGEIGTIALCPSRINPNVTWLPRQRSFSFLADPFGMWHEGRLHVLAEHFDYRNKHGSIRYYTLGPDLILEKEGEALRTSTHLSYPFLVKDGNDIYMLPEAHRSGRVALYRATRFPHEWQYVCEVLPEPGVDPSIVHYNGLWWLAYSRPRRRREAVDEFHIAFAETITGPWHRHPANPIRESADSSRPAGTPFVVDGTLYFPTQDSRRSYGDAVTVLRTTLLTPIEAVFEPVSSVTPSSIGLGDFAGLHTISGCGHLTLIDAKSFDLSPARHLINLQRRVSRFARRLSG